MVQLRFLACLTLLTMTICFPLNAQEIENLARNGDFEEAIDEWNIRQSEGTAAKIEEDNKERIKGKAGVFIEIDLAKGDYWHISLFQEAHFLKGGKEYTLAAWAKAEKPRTIIPYIEETVDPWDEFGRESFVISKEWQEYWSTFTAPRNVPDAWLRIALGESDANLWIDNPRRETSV